MSRLEIPRLSSPITPASVNQWLNVCEDSFMVHSIVNPTSTLSPGVQIVLAGIKMEDPTAAAWWNDNRDDLKKLTKWEDFATRVRARLVPTGWKIEALRTFYAVRQGVRAFTDFVLELQGARNALGTSGSYAIKDFVFKNHLLFHAQDVLSLRVMAIPTFNIETITVDGLISLMASTSDSMLAEKVIHVSPPVRAIPRYMGTHSTASSPLRMPAPSSHNSTPPSRASTPSMPYTLPELTYAERQNLKALGGCYHCHMTPDHPNWKQHFACDCPGDPSQGIPPRWSNPTTFVAAVGMSSCVIGDGTDSDNSDEDYGCGGY
jgi:hypothetical protein